MRNYFNKSSTYKGKAALYITYMSTAKKTAKSTGAAKSPGAAGMAQRAIEIDELDGRVVSGSSLQDFDQAPIRATLIGSDHCEVDGIVARGHAPVLGLCRALLAAGYDPRRPLHAYRGDTIALIIHSIGEGARLTVEDNRRGTPVLAQLARLLGRTAARQWLSNRTIGGESNSEEQQKASRQGPST